MTGQDFSGEMTLMLGREPTEQERALLYDFRSDDGIACKLWRRIDKVNIDHPTIIAAFRSFINKSRDDMSFRLVDFLSFNESVCKKSFSYGKVGDNILCFAQNPKEKKLVKWIYSNSVNGLYELIDRTNGFAIEISGLEPGTIAGLMEKRFVFADKKRTEKYRKKALAEGISIYKLGFVTSEKRVTICNNGKAEVNLDKSMLIPSDNGEPITIDIRSNMLEQFEKGYISVLCYKYGLSAMRKFPIVIGASSDISQIFTVLLGINYALRALSLSAVKLLFSEGTDVGLSVGYAKANDGDKVYLIKPSYINDGMPLSDSYNCINSYLLYNAPNIALCPIIKDITSALGMMINSDEYEFIPSAEYNQYEKAKTSVLVLSRLDIDGKLIGHVRQKH
ncbi:MAG: hypothetical protein PHD66_07095 [Eubacteriales bacterium]|nr:hypothetical protein [Eubacteriales bacterium]